MFFSPFERSFLLIITLLTIPTIRSQSVYDEESPLLKASIENSSIDDINRLLGEGFSPNVKNSAGWTPLIFAVNNNNENIVKNLINAGASIDETENDGWSALLFAVFRESIELAEILLTNNANPYILSVQGISPFSIASERHLTPVLSAIERYRERRATIEQMNGNLLDACLEGDKDSIENLLTNGAEVNSFNSVGYSPLIAAARNACLECVRILIQAGADVYHKEKDGWTALMFASTSVNIYLLIIFHNTLITFKSRALSKS